MLYLANQKLGEGGLHDPKALVKECLFLPASLSWRLALLAISGADYKVVGSKGWVIQ